jgi:ketosteroid isomerase-like protein
MAGSRAASAREPGQIREEAALSDTARAPRASLAGAEDRRARPRSSSRDGCTVHFFMPEPRDIVKQVSERWNAGDFEGLLELYHDDVSVHTGEHWPERHVLQGKAAFRESIDEWLSVWESIAVETTTWRPTATAWYSRRVAVHRPHERCGGNDADSHRVYRQGWEDRSC